MASILGTLGVNIIARTDGIDKGLKKGGKQLKWYEKQALATTKHVKKAFLGLGAGIAAAFGAGAIINSFRQSAEQLDNLAKTSSKLGILPERLAGLRHAGEQTGVAVSTMDMALQRFTRRTAEAAKGTGEAKGALRELGLDASALVKMPLSQQMGIIADRMNAVETQADRVRIAMKLFDSEGVSLVNTLGLGSDGLREMQQEANRLGLTFSSKDLKRVEALNDSLASLRKQFNSQIGQLLIDITPQAMESIRVLRTVIGVTFQGGGFVSDDEVRETRIMNAATRKNPIVQDLLRRDREEHARRTADLAKRQGSVMASIAGAGLSFGNQGPLRLEDIATRVAAQTGLFGAFAGTPGIVGSGFTESQYRDEIRERRIRLLQGRIAEREQQQGGGRSDNRILERGSAEAFKALRANLNRNEDKQLKAMKEQLEELVASRQTLEKLEKSLDFEVVR